MTDAVLLSGGRLEDYWVALGALNVQNLHLLFPSLVQSSGRSARSNAVGVEMDCASFN